MVSESMLVELPVLPVFSSHQEKAIWSNEIHHHLVAYHDFVQSTRYADLLMRFYCEGKQTCARCTKWW